MKNVAIKNRTIFVAVFLLASLLSLPRIEQGKSLQTKGDYLNEQEVERVQEAQEIEIRTRVFLFIADRRLKVLTGELKTQTAKQLEAWRCCCRKEARPSYWMHIQRRCLN